MSACASLCIFCKAVANFSNSSSDADPSSLQGARCNANSITPSAKIHDKALPPHLPSCLASTLTLCTSAPSVVKALSAKLHRLLHAVHLFNLVLHPRRNRIPLQLPIHRQHPALNRKAFSSHHKRPHLLVVRQIRIDHIERRLHIFRRYGSRHDHRQIAPSIAHHHHLLRFRQLLRNRSLDRFRRNLVARSQHDQILDPPRNPPIPRLIHFALIAGMEPSVVQRLGSLLRPVPVASKNVRPSYQDFVILTQSHLHAGNRRPHASHFHMIRIIHRANRRRLREPVNLQHTNSQHHEIKLRLGSQRRRPANQRLKIPSDHLLPDRGKHYTIRQSQPQPVTCLRLPILPPRPCAFRSRINRQSHSACLPELFVHGAPHALQQLGHIQEIIRGHHPHVTRDLRQIGVYRDHAAPLQKRQQRNPRGRECERQIMKDAILRFYP